MDPGFYRNMSEVMGNVPPRPELSEEDLARVGDPSVPQNPDWTVYSQNVLRGNLEPMEDLNPDDPRMSVGWKAKEAEKEAEMKTPSAGAEPKRPWMSATQQQPFMWGDMAVDEA